MKGIETQILRVVRELGLAEKEAIARKIGVTSEYAAELCRHLAQDGYLINSQNGQYKITRKSGEKLSTVVSRGHIPVLKGGG